MSVVLRIEGWADGSLDPPTGAYIASFDTTEGLVVTDRLDQALRFAMADDAVAFWRQELPQGVEGHNPTGPNRPLTAFTIAIEGQDDEA